MSDQAIPLGTDLLQLSVLCIASLGRGFTYDGQSVTFPAVVTFTPDLTPTEITTFNRLVDVASAKINFQNLPSWATFTSQEASDFILNNILSGQTQAQLDALINTNIANITVANVTQINTALAGIRSAFSLVASGIISIRTILQALAKAIVFLRNLVVH